MDEQEQVIEKVRKILALQSSPNPNEAANAATAARRLLMKYNLSLEDIVDKEEASKFTTEVWRRHLAFSKINLSLACPVAELYFCRILTGGLQSPTYLAGRPENVKIAKDVLNHLFQEMETTVHAHPRLHGRTAMDTFRRGWIHAVVCRLMEDKKEDTVDERALVVREMAEVEDYLEKEGVGTRHNEGDRGIEDERSFIEGLRAGLQANIHKNELLEN